ncbi:hypothetical protein EDB85DRAFT_1900085 [Lactarius pseudohatsudake]|nr:hypothetical protein EDB85DRAFT_1900085 [Lactarius pseudohatsudake]
MTGSASHASLHFCSFCKLPLHKVDNLEVNSWPIHTWEEHMQSARNWKNTSSTAARLRLYRQNGVWWSELLCLPYWDPMTFTVLDCMHSLLLGDLQRHCRYIWGMDFQLKDDDFHVKPDGNGYFVTEDEVRHGHHVLEHRTDGEVAALSFNVLHRICQDTQMIRFNRKRKNQLIEALLQYRVTLGWSPSSAVHNSAANDSVTPTSSNTETSASIPKPRRNELATGTELQDRQVKYALAKSLSKIQGFRKGLIVALLLNLDVPPLPGNLDELWKMSKPPLARMLWDMHQKGARLRTSASSHPIQETHGVRNSSWNFAEPHFAAPNEYSLNEDFLEGSVHSSDIMLAEEMAGGDSESMSFASTAATTEISTATDDRNMDEIRLAEDREDALPPGSQKKPSRKECVVLGQKTLAEVWANMSKITLPSWIGRVPPKLGDRRHGKLSTDQWHTACTVVLPQPGSL